MQTIDTDYVVMFISAEYVSKKWTRHERRSALSKALEEKDEFILPVRFDDTTVPSMPNTRICVDAKDYAPEVLAAGICEKIGIPAFAGKASAVPPPQMTSNMGEVVFDYSSFNGRYIIGNGLLLFETLWTKASDVDKPGTPLHHSAPDRFLSGSRNRQGHNRARKYITWNESVP